MPTTKKQAPAQIITQTGVLTMVIPHVIPTFDETKPPPITSEVTNQKKIFTNPAETTTNILQKPRKFRRVSQAEREQFVRTKLPVELQKALNEPFGKNNIRQSFYSEVKLRHVLVFVRDFLDLRTRTIFQSVNSDAKLLEELLVECSHLDCAPIKGFQKNWTNQKDIPEQRTKLFMAAMIQHRFDTANLVRWIGGRHTAQHRNTKHIIETIAESVDTDTLTNLARILTSGLPTICQASATDKNLQSYIDYGNHPTIETNWEKMYKTAAKDTRTGYVLHFDQRIHWFVYHLHVTLQGIANVDNHY
jgi:hypothetical protein